jgi:long-chain acyl-CoA synthetase
MMPNLLQYPVALFGTLRAGCVVVNCNPLYTPRELEHQLKDSGATAIVIVENFANTLEQVIAHTAIKHIVVTPMGEMLGGSRACWSISSSATSRNWCRPGPCRQRSASPRRWPPVAAKAWRAVSLNHDDMAFLQYTGGTTGVSKGAMLTHANITSNVMQAYNWIKPVVREGEEFIITALPLYHIFALTANCLTFLMIGARNLLIANPRDIPGFIKEWGKYPVTVVTGVNTLFNALLNNADFAKLDFSTMKITLGGGMAVQGPVAERWLAVTGVPLLQAYGLTETSPAATINPLDMKEFNGSIGLPISSTEVSIRDDYGKEVPQGQVGEICMRGPQVMKRLLAAPGGNGQCLLPMVSCAPATWATSTKQGFVFLVDRKKDMILVSGFNVYPNEVEEAVAMHEGVADVAAIGVPTNGPGEAVKIFVVRKDPRSPNEVDRALPQASDRLQSPQTR